MQVLEHQPGILGLHFALHLHRRVAHVDFGLSVSGARALWATITPGRSEFPSATSVLLRSMMTGSVRNQRESMRGDAIDLLVTMHLPGIGMLEFERTREVAEAGYHASKDTVAEWAATRAELGVVSCCC